MSEAQVKALLDAVISLLVFLVPVLGGLTRLPVLGWVVRQVISYLTGLLARVIARRIEFSEIDKRVELEVEAAHAATEKLKEVQSRDATDAEKKKAIADFKDALRKLTRSSL